MKNEKLTLLLSFLICHSGLNALAQESTVPVEKDETLLDFKKDSQKPIVTKQSKFIKILKGSAYSVGGYSTIRTVDDLYNSYQKSKFLSLLNEYKNSPYNQKLDFFLNITDELMTEHNKNDNGTMTDVHMIVKYLIAKLLLFKSDDDISKEIFASVKSANGVVCAGCTHVLHTIAEHLGLKAYNLVMYNSKKMEGHSVLIIAIRLENERWCWLVIDGRNYTSLKNTFPDKRQWVLGAMVPVLYKEYDHKYILYRNIAGFSVWTLKNEIGAELNEKLLYRLVDGNDVNWTDESYVKKLNFLDQKNVPD